MDRHRVGDAVRARREARKLSLRAAAEAAGGGIGHSTWNQIETGDLNTTIDMLATVAKTLGARWDIRLVPDGEGSTTRAPILDRLASIIDRLDDRDFRRLVTRSSRPRPRRTARAQQRWTPAPVTDPV